MINRSFANCIKGSLLLFFILFVSTSAKATHLAGGYMQCTYLGNNQYKLKLHIYRDCADDGHNDLAIPLDPTITICIYKKNGSLLQSLSVNLDSKQFVNPLPAKNGCLPSNGVHCFEHGLYVATVSLPAGAPGYHVKWERCCRHRNNLADDHGETYQGETFYAFIPASDLGNTSVSTEYVPLPVMCIFDTATFALQFKDVDGDSLSYELVTPLQGASISNPLPESCPETFSLATGVVYRDSFGLAAPFGKNGFIELDPKSGLLRLMSSNFGFFAFTVKVTEWRNKIAITDTRVDLTAIVHDAFGRVANADSQELFLVYPNPSNTELYVSFGNDAGVSTWLLADAAGRIIRDGKVSGNFNLETSAIASGLYWLVIERDGMPNTRQVVIEH